MKYFYLIASLCFALNSEAAPPTIPATNLSFNVIEGGYFNVGWTPGNGSRRIMIVRAGQAVTAVPQNGIDYAENTNFGSGQAILPGQFVVYDNAFTSFFLTGLTPATQYFIAIFEYNGTGAGIEYLTSSFLSGNAFTASAPTLQASNLSFTNITATSVTVSCTAGNGSRRMIVAREAAPVNSNPIDLQPYSGNNAFGSGAQMGAGNYSVYSSSGTSVNVTNLKAGTQYFFSVYDYNGNSQPVYLTPGSVANVTTRTVPTIPSSNIIVSKTDGKELTINWTSGNGQRRIVVAKQGAALTALPVNGMDYIPNDIFGNGATLAAGEYVVYSGTGNAAIIKGLSAATEYYFRVFEYDGTGSNTLYLTNLFANANAFTAETPTQQVTGIAATNGQGTSIGLTWLAGNGRARLVIARKDAAVNVNPQDFTAYLANSDFGSGQDLGNGNFVISNTNDLFVTIHSLQANTTYHFAIFEFNGFNQPLYLRPGAIFSVTTLGAVPVKLLDWKAVLASGKVNLNWKTQSENNASHFNIQRSTDGINFSTITTVQATGSSQVTVNYSAVDISPLIGNSFYRLEMIDKDGKIEYSETIKISIQKAEDQARIINNPAGQKLEVNIAALANTIVEWRIINAAGQQLKTGKTQSGRLEINIGNLALGMYWLQVKQSDKSTSIAFIKN
jgi:hypothetical protein